MVPKDKEIMITFETLFELFRREKGREELQKLSPSFLNDVVEYLKDKNQFLEAQKNKQDIFSSTERDKIEKEIKNIKDTIKSLYDRRERKIINLALDKARAPNMLVDTSTLLDEEKKLFDAIIDRLGKHRIGVLLNVLNMQPPVIEEAKQEEPPIFKEEDEKTEEKEKTEATEDGKDEKTEAANNTKQVRFLHPVPKFVGEDLEVFGPYDEEDIANLPTNIANVLINKKRAEEIKDG